MRAILTYHSIDDSGSVVSVHPERFREHLTLLAERRVPVVSLGELVASGAESGVALTFDDGFVNFADVAWPLLCEYAMPATVFVATDWVGRENAWDPQDARIPRLPLMGWTTLGDLAREGLDVQSHTCSHPHLEALGERELRRELIESRTAIAERLGHDVHGVAYPYGGYDARVASAAQAAGYAYAVTTELRPLGEADASPFALPRLDAFYLAKPGVMEMWGTPALGRYVTLRRAARRARATLAGLRRAPSTGARGEDHHA
jgi:peptidoglycan/xylan/chitin deacetylase (PgdA/CDA1 family)